VVARRKAKDRKKIRIKVKGAEERMNFWYSKKRRRKRHTKERLGGE